MNIFYLDSVEQICAEMHNNKHVVKMILEYSQLLSTAHRVLDGVETETVSKTGRKKKVWKLNNSYEEVVYQATHINHPSAIWCRNSYENYTYLARLLKNLCKEYTYRYGKVHKCESSGLVDKLQYTPLNIKPGAFTQPTPAMPEEYKVSGDSISSYRNYYNNSKQHLANWKGKINGRNVPEWFLLS